MKSLRSPQNSGEGLETTKKLRAIFYFFCLTFKNITEIQSKSQGFLRIPARKVYLNFAFVWKNFKRGLWESYRYINSFKQLNRIFTHSMFNSHRFIYKNLHLNKDWCPSLKSFAPIYNWASSTKCDHLYYDGIEMNECYLYPYRMKNVNISINMKGIKQ